MDKKWLRNLVVLMTFPVSWFLAKYVLQIMGLDSRFDPIMLDITLKRIFNAGLLFLFWYADFKVMRMFRMPRAFAEEKQDFGQFAKLAVTGLALTYAYFLARNVLNTTFINSFNVVLELQEILRWATIIGEKEPINRELSQLVTNLIALSVTAAMMIETIGVLRLVKIVAEKIRSFFTLSHSPLSVKIPST